MIERSRQFGLLVPITLGAAVASAAPADEECALIMTPDEAAMGWELHQSGMYELPPADPDGTLYVAITHHIVRRSDGTGGIPEERLEVAVADANVAFEEAGIQFCVPGPIDYIDNDAFYSYPDSGALRRTNVVPNTINIYYVGQASYCGLSSFTFSSSQGIIMLNDCTATETNHSTFPHEIGHYFDLFHTHETSYGAECVDGSNCAIAGDLVCDTPADPVLSNRVNSNCEYTGNDRDRCNNELYRPDPLNFMSYSTKPCRVYFTSDQSARARATLLNLRPEYILPDCGNSYALQVGDLTGGQSASMSVSNATPNETQYFVYSLTGPGSTFVPALQVSLDLDRPQLGASAVADANGDASIEPFIPLAGSGRTIWLQAAEFGRVTNVESRLIN